MSPSRMLNKECTMAGSCKWLHVNSITYFAAKMLVTANLAMLKDRELLCLLKCLSVCHDRQHQNVRKTGIIPGLYLILMYIWRISYKPFLRNCFGRMNGGIHKNYSSGGGQSKILVKNTLAVNNNNWFTLYFRHLNQSKYIPKKMQTRLATIQP